MSEIRYCYHCHRGQPTIAQPSGFATCATCGTDELGEVVDPALTRTMSDEVPAVRYEAAPAPGPVCAICGAVDAGEYLGRGADTRSVYLCDTCAVDRRVIKKETWSMERGHVISVERAEQAPAPPAPPTFADIAKQVANMVTMKQAAYGDSFGRSGEVLAILYPNGIPIEAYGDALAIVRVLDKLFRIATDRDALGESPWRDIAGYSLLAVRRIEQDKGAK